MRCIVKVLSYVVYGGYWHISIELICNILYTESILLPLCVGIFKSSKCFF